MFKDLLAAIQARNWPEVAGIVALIVGFLARPTANAAPVSQASPDAADLEACCDALAECKVECERPTVAAAPAVGLDPATILLIVQLAGKVLEAIRKRRQGG